MYLYVHVRHTFMRLISKVGCNVELTPRKGKTLMELPCISGTNSWGKPSGSTSRDFSVTPYVHESIKGSNLDNFNGNKHILPTISHTFSSGEH